MSQDNRGGRGGGGGQQKGEDLKISCATARAIKRVKFADRSPQERKLLGAHFAECEECAEGGGGGGDKTTDSKPKSAWEKFKGSPAMLGLMGKPLKKDDKT